MINAEFITVLQVIVISYLLGSLPTGYVIAKTRGYDIFKEGSGNIGASNITRTLGVRYGLLVWILDSFKGMLAISLAQIWMPKDLAFATTLAAVMAIIGHNWSIVIALLTGKLAGGKGAATAFGTLLMIAPLNVIAIAFAACSAAVILTRYISLGVLIMFGLALPWLLVLSLQQVMSPWFTFYATLTALMILLRFRENIQRLMTGTERRLSLAPVRDKLR
jgi:glycerol-3-phosphate acyltransferase PlsY